ncbi:MAG: TolC family protein [Acidobacteria bacterium]|nr:TolC family protein [Acidobacteriota bacterium]
MTAKIAICVVLLAGCAAGAEGQISLSSAVDLALRNDPRVKMSEAAVQKAQAALDGTRDVYVPNIMANVGYGQGFGVPTGLPTVFSLSSDSLLFNFSQRDNIRSAASGVASAKLALKNASNEVEEDVVTTYLNLDTDERSEAAMLDEYGFAQRLVAIVQDRLDAGQDTRLELLRAERTAKEIELQKLQIEDDIAVLSDRLSRAIGLPSGQINAVPESIPDLPTVQAVAGDSDRPDGYAVEAAMASARAKQEFAFGVGRYRLRPQLSLELNYSRIDTAQNSYTTYYPGFIGKSENAVSVGIALTLPIYDRHHQDQANEAIAEATRAHFEAEDQRNQFLEGRVKLRHSAMELAAHSDLAEIDRDLAQEQLNVVLAQETANNANVGPQQVTPKDEEKARIAESARTIDLLNAQFQVNQAKVNLLRQNGRLDEWLKMALSNESRLATPTVSR